MAENKTMDSIQKSLIKKYHTLCGVCGLEDWEKAALLEGYGVDSSRDLDQHQLIDLCAMLSERVEHMRDPETAKLRKRAMASIGSYLRKTRQASSAERIKAIACRATGHRSFNKIPKERLRNLIGAFNNKVKDIEAVEDVTRDLTSAKIIPLNTNRTAFKPN